MLPLLLTANVKMKVTLTVAAVAAGTAMALDNGRATRPPMGW
jgi:hypothetical protein